MITNIVDIPDSTLISIIYDSDNVTFNFFALKVMISRLKLKLSIENDELTKQECVNDLRELFRKSKNIPNAIKDMKMIVEKYELNNE